METVSELVMLSQTATMAKCSVKVSANIQKMDSSESKGRKCLRRVDLGSWEGLEFSHPDIFFRC